MNRKEKNIVRGFLSAVKYASQVESRVRVMLIGDTGSGEGCGQDWILQPTAHAQRGSGCGLFDDGLKQNM